MYAHLGLHYIDLSTCCPAKCQPQRTETTVKLLLDSEQHQTPVVCSQVIVAVV